MVKPDQKIVISSHEELDWAYNVTAVTDDKAPGEDFDVTTATDPPTVPSASRTNHAATGADPPAAADTVAPVASASTSALASASTSAAASASTSAVASASASAAAAAASSSSSSSH